MDTNIDNIKTYEDYVEYRNMINDSIALLGKYEFMEKSIHSKLQELNNKFPEYTAQYHEKLFNYKNPVTVSNKFELKDCLPDKNYCDDPLFELFEGTELRPEKYLKHIEDIELVNNALNVIKRYLIILCENHQLES